MSSEWWKVDEVDKSLRSESQAKTRTPNAESEIQHQIMTRHIIEGQKRDYAQKTVTEGRVIIQKTVT